MALIVLAGCREVNTELLGDGLPPESDTLWVHTALSGVQANALLSLETQTLLVGTAVGVYRSADAGASWQLAADVPETPVAALAAGSGRLYAATAAGLYCSDDLGASWTRTLVQRGDLLAVAVTAVGAVLAAGPTPGVLRAEATAAGLAGWTRQLDGLPGTGLRSLFAHPAGFVLAGTDRLGIYRSDDGGQTWHPAGLDGTTVQAFGLSADGTLFAGTEDQRAFRSLDDGRTWMAVGPEPVATPSVRSFAASPGGDVFAGTGGGGAFRTPDAGWSWRPLNDAVLGFDIFALAVAGGRLYAGTPRGVFRTIDPIE